MVDSDDVEDGPEGEVMASLHQRPLLEAVSASATNSRNASS